MKSILVDALRQANGDDTDQALSDSGSFDASQDALASPANDIIDEQDSELELMSTTNALVVTEEVEQEPEEIEAVHPEPDDIALEAEANFETVAYEPVDDDHAMTVAGMMPLPVTRRQAPRLARFAPLLCIALALTVAAGWLLINRLGVLDVSLGTTVAQVNGGQAVDDVASDPVPSSRFRFLDGDELGTEGGSAQ